MPYDIENKLVVGVSSSALFDLQESDTIFREKGRETYRSYQRDNQDKPLNRGVAFPFVRRILGLNAVFPDLQPVEVILLSQNDPDTGLRVMNTIKTYGLDISRSVFTSGQPPYRYIPALNCCLFLSANPDDVRDAINAGYPAGTVLESTGEDDPDDRELRIAFDFDGVIADDQAEAVFQESGDLGEFQDFETSQVNIPHGPGPLQGLFTRLSAFQKLEEEKALKEPGYKPVLRTAIVTARSAPAHERLVTTLRNWGVSADETIFLGGIEKRRVLEILKPHIYFDDQVKHLLPAASTVPLVHIPFGVINR